MHIAEQPVFTRSKVRGMRIWGTSLVSPPNTEHDLVLMNFVFDDRLWLFFFVYSLDTFVSLMVVDTLLIYSDEVILPRLISVVGGERPCSHVNSPFLVLSSLEMREPLTKSPYFFANFQSRSYS